MSRMVGHSDEDEPGLRTYAGSSRGRTRTLHGWWLTHRGDLGKDAVVGLVVGVVLFLGAMVWDDRLARQDRLVRELAEQAEVLEEQGLYGKWRATTQR